MNAFLACRRFVREGHVWHGLQIAVSIAMAFAVARAIGLPEPHWAVISALIVTRPEAGATLAAGWQRLGATLGGSIIGLSVVVLASALGWSFDLASLLLVAALSFATADRIGWRSAPLAALIVMMAGQSGASPIEIGILRTLSIGIGAVIAILTAFLARYLSATTRPHAVISDLLRQLAKQLSASASTDKLAREAHGAAVRNTVRRLGEMVHGTKDQGRRQLLGLAMRLVQDAGWLARLLSTAASDPDSKAHLTASEVSAALDAIADQMSNGKLPSKEAIALLGQSADHAWKVDPVPMLREDLGKLLSLCRTVGHG